MKKLKSILLSICMLGTVCGLTGCGGEKWKFYENEGVTVSNYDCESIISSDKEEDIRQFLEKKYKNAKLTVTEDSIKGLLKDDISLEKEDNDDYFEAFMRAEELDSIFEVNGHTVETYVEICGYKDEGFMEYEIYAIYDNNEDINCFAEIDFISSDFKEE